MQHRVLVCECTRHENNASRHLSPLIVVRPLAAATLLTVFYRQPEDFFVYELTAFQERRTPKTVRTCRGFVHLGGSESYHCLLAYKVRYTNTDYVRY